MQVSGGSVNTSGLGLAVPVVTKVMVRVLPKPVTRTSRSHVSPTTSTNCTTSPSSVQVGHAMLPAQSKARVTDAMLMLPPLGRAEAPSSKSTSNSCPTAKLAFGGGERTLLIVEHWRADTHE